MAHDPHHASEVPEELVRDHYVIWQRFTSFTFIGCVIVALSLLVGLVLIKI